MKSKKTIIISSLIMCLTLIVAIVSVTAAWFGNVTSGRIDTNLTINSDTVDESANVEIDSSVTGLGNDVYPAIALKGRHEAAYPGNYGVVEGKEYDPSAAGKLYPVGKEGSVDATIEKNAKVATIYLTIDYIGAVDQGATDGKKTLLMSLDGVYLRSALGDSPNYEDPLLVNYKEEFNVKMSVVKNTAAEGEEANFVPDESAECYNQYNEKNPYGHLMYFKVKPGHYTIKFEIYFNKVDEECNFDLLNTTLSLRIRLTKDTAPWTSWENIGNKEGA